MKNIYQYLDYQQFLKEFYEEKKNENFFFSYRYMSGKLGLDPSFIVKILQGKRHLPEGAIPDVCKLCDFSSDEGEYFKTLYAFNREKDDQEVKRLFRELLKLSGMSAESLSQSQYGFYSKWYHSAVRSLIGIEGFNGDFVKLSSSCTPPITVAEAKESFNLLKETGLIVQNDDDNWELSQKSITTGEQWKALAVRIFQEETIDLAKRSLSKHPKEIRDISTMTVAVAESDLIEISELAREFRQSILQLRKSSDSANRVYQVNVQIFPLTKGEGASYD